MDNRSQKTVPAIIAIILLLILSGILFFTSRHNKKELNKEKQTSQSLLEKSEKLMNDIKSLQDEFNRNNKQLDELINEKERIIDENNGKIQRLISENKVGNSAKKQIKEIEAKNNALRSEIEKLKEQLSISTKQTQDQTETITGLQDENRLLKEQNELLTSMISDNVKIIATKGKKHKLTVLASRTNRITAQLDIPASVANSVNFILVYPDGTKISGKDDPSATIKISDNSLVKESGGKANNYKEPTKSLELNYVPKNKLKKGVYKLCVYNESDYLTGIYMALK